MPKKESLPAGVGRVPEWWMELTPHYVLDLEDDEQQRKMMQENEALYCAQMISNDDDGHLLREWKSNWGGRTSNNNNNNNGSGGDSDSALFEGRNFQPGSPGWDPKQWGIQANDPDYQSYLKGAKLPQSYIDAMREFANQVGIKYDASNLKATGGAKSYGSAGKPAFTPAWAKKKLRSTGQGAAIRHGIYDDSPNKHIHKQTMAELQQKATVTPASTTTEEATPTTTTTTTTTTTAEETSNDPVSTPVPAPTLVAPPAPAVAHVVVAARPPAPKWTPPKPTPPPAPAPPPAEYVYNPTPIRSNSPAPVEPQENMAVEKPKYSFNDYYYNAGAPTTPVKTAMPEQAPPKPAVTPAPAPEQPVPPEQDQQEEYEEVVEYVTEYADDDDEQDGEEYEEVVEEYEEEYQDEDQEDQAQSSNLMDLQALLAAKQAELAKLQGM